MIDEKIGQILQMLEAQGYLDDAVVIFTSDHGDALGDHGHSQKWTRYDIIIRINDGHTIRVEGLWNIFVLSLGVPMVVG